MSTRVAAPDHGSAAGVRLPVWRRVEHVMGMPISLALRGRHAGDRYGEVAWARALAVLREADRVFSTYRADSFVSRLGRGEITVADCPAEVGEVLALEVRRRLVKVDDLDLLVLLLEEGLQPLEP